MAKSITMEIFRAGKQTDAAGNEKVWTEDDLDKIIAKSTEMKEDVPATLGHPKDNAPAFGWFKCKDLFRKGKVLFAKMTDITKEFGEALERKNFKNRSIALRPDFSLRHIAFLGGAMPAVKGMAELKFKEDEEYITIDFTEEGETTDSLLKKVLNKLNTFIKQEKEDLNTDPNNQGTNPNNGGNNMDFEKAYNEELAKTEKLTADLEAANKTIEENASFKEKFETSEKEKAELQESIEKTAAAAKDKEYSDFAEGLVKDQKILPAEKEAVVAMQRTLDGQEAIDFAEGDKTVKKTPLDIYKLGLENKTVGGLFGEKFQNPGTPAEALEAEINSKTNEIMKEEKCSFNEASKKLMAKEPGLFKDLKFSEPAE